jgi:alpha(1,3/1,4) fucosyltransferase
MKHFFLGLLLLPIFLSASYRERVKQIYITQDWTPNPNDQAFADSGTLKDIHQVLKLKHTSLKITDLSNEKDSSELTYVVVFSKPHYLNAKILDRFSPKKAVLFMWEPPVVQKNLYESSFTSRFKRVYTWNDDLVDNKKFFKFYYPVLRQIQTELPSFKERKLLTQISCNKKSKHQKELYSARISVIDFFQDKPEGEFEFYGHGWAKGNYRHYKGSIENKLDALKNYRFSVCYENMCDIKGYITEKIFDCFATGTIPIYWGASNVTDYIPKECFIDRRDFGSFEEVYDYIRSMDAETYQTYLQNIQGFLESDRARLFSQEMFNVIFLEAVRFP